MGPQPGDRRELCLDVLTIPDGALTPGDVGVLGSVGKPLRGANLADGFLTDETKQTLKVGVTFHRSHFASCPDRERFKR